MGQLYLVSDCNIGSKWRTQFWKISFPFSWEFVHCNFSCCILFIGTPSKDHTGNMINANKGKNDTYLVLRIENLKNSFG